MSALGGLWGLTKAVTDRVMRHSQMARASQFAYVAFLASIPFAFVLISVFGLVASPSAYSSLIDRARGTIPDQLADFLDELLQSASSSTGRPHRSWLRGKARAIITAVITALVFVVATLLSVVGPPVLQWVAEQVGAGPATQVLVQVGVALAGAAIFWGFLVLLYRYAPSASTSTTSARTTACTAASAPWSYSWCSSTSPG